VFNSKTFRSLTVCDGSTFSRSEVTRRDKVRESERHRLVDWTGLFQTFYLQYVHAPIPRCAELFTLFAGARSVLQTKLIYMYRFRGALSCSRCSQARAVSYKLSLFTGVRSGRVDGTDRSVTA